MSDADVVPRESDLDDGTVFVRRSRVRTPPPDEVEEAHEVDEADEVDDVTLPPRPPGEHTDEPGLRHRAPGLDADTGSTVVVRRESRRRAEAAAREAHADLDQTIVGSGRSPLPATIAGDVPAARGRRAYAPRAAEIVHDPRGPRPVEVTAPRAGALRPAHSPQEPVDGVAAEAGVRRRARRRAVVVVAAASAVVIAALAMVLVLAFAL